MNVALPRWISLQRNRLWFLALLLGLALGVEMIARVGAEMLWFQEVGYLPMYRLRLATQASVGLVGFTTTALYCLGNLQLAQRLKYPDRLPEAKPAVQSRDRHSLPPFPQAAPSPLPLTPLRLRWLLPLTLGLSLMAAMLLMHSGQVALQAWHPQSSGPNQTLPVPQFFQLETIGQWAGPLRAAGWSAGCIVGLAIAVLLYPRVVLWAIALGLSVLLGWILSRQWMTLLPYLQPTVFNRTDPLFGQDISVYVFALPVWEWGLFWLSGLLVYGFIAVALTYLLSGGSLSEGWFPGFSPAQQRHLCGLGSGVMLVVGGRYWLARYELLYSSRGVVYGASYTDVTAQLPAYTGLSLLAFAIAAYLCGQWLCGQWLYGRMSGQRKSARPVLSHRPLMLGLGLYLVLAIAIGQVWPLVVQSLIVQPNELAREQPYIQRTIALTRQAFGLETMAAKTFDPQGNLTEADLQTNALTLRNIRLWDQQPLLATNRQLQQIRLYYRFPDADIDRYPLSDAAKTAPLKPNPQANPTLAPAVVPEPQQVLIAARELDYAAVPKQAQTWVNQHLIYTHGYGFTLSPVNRVGSGGLPEYLVKDIGMTSGSPLTTANAAVRASIPIGQPRIYYGENANTYVMTGTKVKELDYPSGDDNAYNIYDGRGGISLDSPWRRLLFAKYLNDWRMVITPEFLPETKLLFRRNLSRRIRAIAPFLRYDSDPYLVAADARLDPTSAQDPSYLYWIVDAYTTSDRYPYSDVGTEGINYIRNSVKVVVDAYHGSVTFYIADLSDPIIKTWSRVFPDLFKPLSAMPVNLHQHLRYPVDFFKIQSERLMTYHMTDPQVFYNREDQWQIPTEVYGDQPRLVDPYYLITSLPTVPFEEFILLLPFTPKQRTNLVAWLAARSDGEHYGQLVLYNFPKQRLVYGPEQIEARINQDPIISQQISLWNRQGSRVVQGNLLIVPIEQSLLYVEPLYLEATQNRLPTLIRVIVAYENRIVMAQTLQQALQAIFKPTTPAPAPIVRPVATPMPKPGPTS
jgi:uncharacterized protein